MEINTILDGKQKEVIKTIVSILNTPSLELTMAGKGYKAALRDVLLLIEVKK